MSENHSGPTAGSSDRLVSFTIPGRNCRGRIARLGPVLDEILQAHDYPPTVKHVLAEALVLAGLMGGLLKNRDDQLTMQAQAKGGVISLLVCDYRDGAVRGYVEFDPAEFDTLGASPDLPALFGEGFLAITFDLASTDQRYQGIVPLDGSSITAAVEAYFAQSEQVPTLIRTAVRSGHSGSMAGGILVQHLPDGEEGRERLHVRFDEPDWDHVRILGESIRAEEILEHSLPLEDLIWRLYHEEPEIRVQDVVDLSRGCRCTREHFEQVLSRFASADRREMADEQGVITVDCAFCSRKFAIED